MAKRTLAPGKCRNDWLLLAITLITGIQLGILIARSLRHKAQEEQIEARHWRENPPTGHPRTPTGEFPVQQSPKPSARDQCHSLNPPNPIIKNLYLEITNIAQGVNIGVFVFGITLLITRPDEFSTSLSHGYFSAPLFAIANLLVVVTFWARYYLDTEILDRSFTVLSTSWFFVYAVTQGVSIGLVNNPCAWLGSTSAFLFFGAGFYVLNLREIRRKQRAGIMPERPEFVNWQTKRMIDLIILSLVAFIGIFLVARQPILALPGSICALIVAVWQLTVTGDYRRLAFLRMGV